MKNIFKLANNFEIYINATLKEDLAKRILFGLGDYLGVSKNKSFIQMPDGSYKSVDLIALRGLIPQAKKILKYGIKTCLKELEHVLQDRLTNIDKNKLKELYNSSLDDEKILLNLIYFFNKTEYWFLGFGGKAWAKITKILLDIFYNTQDAIIARKNNEIEKEITLLSELTININLFEGMTHNSNGILHKMYRNELTELDPENNDFKWMQKKIQLEDELDILMDSKELENPNDTISNIIPNIKYNKTKQRDSFTEYIDAAVGKLDNHNYDYNKIKIELRKIKNIRKIQFYIKEIKNIIDSLKDLKNINFLDKRDIIINFIFGVLDIVEIRISDIKYNFNYDIKFNIKNLELEIKILKRKNYDEDIYDELLIFIDKLIAKLNELILKFQKFEEEFVKSKNDEVNKLNKKASIKEDLAKRMLFGLGDYLGVSEGRTYTKMPDGSYRNIDILALRDLIPQAEKIVKYGIKACISEIEHIQSKYLYEYEAYEKYKNLNNISNQEITLKNIIYLFDEIYWRPAFGGKAWAKIAKQLFKIYENINLAKNAKKSSNIDEEIKQLNELMININLFEGMVHNTSGILDKMYKAELSEIDHEMQSPYSNAAADQWVSKKIDLINGLNNLMNAKELKNPKDVVSVALPEARRKKIKQQNAYQKYIDKAELFYSEDNQENIYQEIDKIKKRKKITSDIENLLNDKNTLDFIKNKQDNKYKYDIFIKWIKGIIFTLDAYIKHYNMIDKIPKILNIQDKFSFEYVYTTDPDFLIPQEIFDIYDDISNLINEVIQILREKVDEMS